MGGDEEKQPHPAADTQPDGSSFGFPIYQAPVQYSQTHEQGPYPVVQMNMPGPFQGPLHTGQSQNAFFPVKEGQRSSSSISQLQDSAKVQPTKRRQEAIDAPASPESIKFRRKLKKNDREKQRRFEINERFEKLSSLTGIQHEKPEKHRILGEAINCIVSLQKEVEELKQATKAEKKVSQSSQAASSPHLTHLLSPNRHNPTNSPQTDSTEHHRGDESSIDALATVAAMDSGHYERYEAINYNDVPLRPIAHHEPFSLRSSHHHNQGKEEHLDRILHD